MDPPEYSGILATYKEKPLPSTWDSESTNYSIAKKS